VSAKNRKEFFGNLEDSGISYLHYLLLCLVHVSHYAPIYNL
jgi:hypothetical protein